MGSTISLPSSPRTIASTTVFSAYFIAQSGHYYTLDPTARAAISQAQGQLYALYRILIEQPAEVLSEVSGAASGPSLPSFPLVSPNDTVLTNAINNAVTYIASLNTIIQAITVAQAQAAAAQLAQINASLSTAFGLGSFIIGFSVPDAATCLANLQTHSANLLAIITAVQTAALGE